MKCDDCGFAKNSKEHERCRRRGYTNAMRARRRAEGKCPYCGFHKTSKEHKKCIARRNASGVRNRKRLLKNSLCTTCSSPFGSAAHQACKSTRTKRLAQLREERMAAGVCIKHPSVRVEHSSYCFDCNMKQFAKRHLGAERFHTELRKLWSAQGGLCFYTKTPLVFGLNASVDHIKPVAKGGLSVPENLRWVCVKVNQMKRDLDEVEFIELCRTITCLAETAGSRLSSAVAYRSDGENPGRYNQEPVS